MYPWEGVDDAEPSSLGEDDAEEEDVDGVRTLLRPTVPFYSRRQALDAMASIVRASPPVTRATSELRWFPEPPGSDVYQTPHESEVLGGGDCEDLEMHAAREDLDAGETEVEVCMTVGDGAHRSEHVFGQRHGQRRDRSVEAGMPPLPPARYDRRVCVRVDGEDAMAVQAAATKGQAASKPGGRAITTGGPALDTSDYNVHGIAHWRAKGWDRAAAQVAQQWPQARPLLMEVLPGIKSGASYFSSLYISAWDQAGNQARLQHAADETWQSHWAEHLLRRTYYQQATGMNPQPGQGDFSDYILQFERQYGRPPTNPQNVKAAVRAFIYCATAQEWPNWKNQLAKTLTAPPRTLEMAAVQVITVARGIFPPDAFPVPPHCPECAQRRGYAGPVLQPPEQVTITNVYASSAGDGGTATASAAGATATAAAPAPNPGIAAFAPYTAPAVMPVAAAVVPAAMPVAAALPVTGVSAFTAAQPGQSSAGNTNSGTNTGNTSSTSTTGSTISGTDSGNTTNNITITESPDDADDDGSTDVSTDDGTDDGSTDDGSTDAAGVAMDEFGLMSGGPDDDDMAGLYSGGRDDHDEGGLYSGEAGDEDEDAGAAEDSYVASDTWDDEPQTFGFADGDDIGPVATWVTDQGDEHDDPDGPLNSDFLGSYEPQEGDLSREIGDVLATGGPDEDGSMFEDPGQFDDPESWLATGGDDCEDGTCPME
jgi:hypothetical protein